MKTFDILGDPHLGRTFVQNVPLARRGERERMVWDDFKSSLMNADKDFHICMGDLFDKPVVSLETIQTAARLYMNACIKNPDTTYVVLRGNHDASRDLTKVSAFDVFSLIVASSPVVVVSTPVQIMGLQFFPWDPIIPANELVSMLGPGKVAFGHWDIDSYGNDFNLIPTKLLDVEKAYTGHIHHPQKFARDGIDVVVTGSMQPYAHGEDPDGTLYVTKTLKEVTDNPDAFKNKCLRVDLAEGETFDLSIDCLQLIVRRPEQGAVEAEVSLGDFDILDLFDQAFSTEQVPQSVKEAILAQYGNG